MSLKSGTGTRKRPWLIVNSAFNARGGQELANFVLARNLVAVGRTVTLVGHEVDPSLEGRASKAVCVPRPLGSAFLGERLLERAARSERARMPRDTVFVGNAGNCPGASVSWVHFVHAAWLGELEAPTLRARAVHQLRKMDALRRERRAMASAEIIVANSQRTRSDLIDLLGVRKEKVACVYFGADRSTFPGQALKEPRHRTLLFVGALGWDRRKGLDIALRAFAILARRSEFTHRLVVAGAGTASPWRELAKTLGMGDQVRFVSFVDHVPTLMQAADLLISPSRYESYGLAVQEAICAGLPPLVLANRTGLMERLGPYTEDFSVGSEDPAQWAAKIEDALGNLEALRSRTLLARERILARTWDEFAQEFMILAEHGLDGGLTSASHDASSSTPR